MDYRSAAHCVHLCTWHLVWCPKYRRPVLVGEIAVRFREITLGVAREHGWQVVELAVQPDHVHLFLRVLPTDSPAAVVRAIKGRTSHHLRRLFPHQLGRRRLPTLWTRSYFVATTGRVSSTTVRRYIAAQSEEGA